MPERTLDPNDLGQSEDWEGNNAAFTCPLCGKVFIVSKLIHPKGRICPNLSCGKSKGWIGGGRKSGGQAGIQWTD